MKIKDLPVGEMIGFGEDMDYSPWQRRVSNDRMIWIKLDEDNTFFLNSGNLRGSFDTYAGIPAKKEFITFGCSFWPVSCIRQYLNSVSTDWFHPAYEGQLQGSYCRNSSAGFLSRFNDEELTMLKRQKTISFTPPGIVKQYGKMVELNDLVTLPSAQQAFSNYYSGFEESPLKADQFRALDIPFDGWTRTSSSVNAHTVVCGCYGTESTGYPRRSNNIQPIIVMDGEVELGDQEQRTDITRYQNGIYRPVCSRSGAWSDDTFFGLMF